MSTPRVVLSLVAILLVGANASATEKNASQETLLAQASRGPLQGIDEIVFAVRLTYDDPHWYANIGYFCDDENHKAYAGNGQPDVGQLCKLDVQNRRGLGAV